MYRQAVNFLVFILLTTPSFASLAESSASESRNINLIHIIDLILSGEKPDSPLSDDELDSLSIDQELLINQFLVSENEEYRLILQSDGNLVLRNWATRESLWSSGTHGQNVQRVRLQGDGNLVLRSSQGESIWSSGTSGSGVTRALLQNDGNFVLFDSTGRAVWSSDTEQTPVDTVKPTIRLNGNSSIQLRLDTSFDDLGAVATDDVDGDISSLIVVTGVVNLSQVGVYTLEYNVKDAAGNVADTVTRTIEVTAPPLINSLQAGDQLLVNEQLTSINGRFALLMQSDGNLVIRSLDTNQVLWASNTDGSGAVRVRLQADGNIVMRTNAGSSVWSSGTNGSGRVTLILENDGILVLRDNSGGTIWSTRPDPEEPQDIVRPVITLVGSASVSLTQGGTFNDLGATALDNRDGDISDNIMVSGSVNTSVVGPHILQYNVSDSAGNSAITVIRSVEVLAPPSGGLRVALHSGSALLVNERLISSNQKYTLTMQADGNLVLLDVTANAVLWSANTAGSGAVQVKLQGDGNIVMRGASGGSVWSSRTGGLGGVLLVLQDNGDLVLRDSIGVAVWSTDTSQTGPDTVKPVIELQGDADIELFVGQIFRDDGATALDDIDGDITPRISVTGSVDVNQAGDYSLIYNVQDDAGNLADSVTRRVSVMDRQAGEEILPQSRGVFSTPAAALYSLNDARSLSFPKPIDTGFSGNGHSETWDGRIFVRKRTNGWYASAFRPERITKDSDGTANFKNGAFGSTVLLQAASDAGQLHQNWLAIVPDFSVQGANPFPSTSNGTFSTEGAYATYKALIFVTSTANGDNDQTGYREATFIVRDANTPNADVISADFTGEFQRLSQANGQDIRCIEPSVTIDGRLIVCQSHPDNNGRIDNLTYSWNPTPGATNGWSAPKSIANMYWDDRDVDVDEVKFSVRFPIAEKPLLDATGNDYNRNELVKGAYPWISRDGSELFYQASNEGVSARRTATTVVGRWTGWTFRHIDGPINPNRHRDTRLFLSSPGAFTTMWSPYKDVDNLKIPYSVRGPSYPIFGSNNEDYSEVGFDDYLDGNFVLYYGMNEQVARSGAYQRTRTNDTSGNFNNGTLVGAQFPLEYNAQDVLVGRYGQAIYFPRGSYIEVSKNQGWDSLTSGVTVDFWLRKVNGSGTIPLFSLANGIEISLLNGNTVSASVTDVNGTNASVTGVGVANNNWSHIAFSFDPITQEMSLYQDGRLITTRTISSFGTLRTSQGLRLGPQSANALLLLDEVKVSNVVREPHEIAHYANVNSHQAASDTLLSIVPDHLRSLRFNATGVDRYSSAAAELGEQLFDDVILSKQRTTSCSTCHEAAKAFTDGKAIAQGNEPTDAGERNTPPLQNRLFSSLQGWSGEVNALDVQALVPIQAEHEMNLPMSEAIQRLQDNTDYRSLFQNVYGELPNEDNISAALASFQASQFSPRNKVDDYFAGSSTVLNSQEKRGLDLFFGEARCSGCHSGANYTDESFRNNGLTSDGDIGRAEITGRDRDFRLFKVPTLRQLVQTGPYMHDGSIVSLQEVVRAYNLGAPSVTEKDTDIRPLELSDQEQSDLVRFLEALSD